MKESNRPFWALILVLGGLGVLVAVSRRNSSGEKELIPWRHDFAAAQAEAGKTGKPVFAYFGATWCGPCQSLKSTVWADPQVAKMLEGYVPVHVDIDEQPELSRRYVATPTNPDGAIPAFRVIGADGQIVKEAAGAMPPGDFLDWLGPK